MSNDPGLVVTTEGGTVRVRELLSGEQHVISSGDCQGWATGRVAIRFILGGVAYQVVPVTAASNVGAIVRTLPPVLPSRRERMRQLVAGLAA